MKQLIVYVQSIIITCQISAMLCKIMQIKEKEIQTYILCCKKLITLYCVLHYYVTYLIVWKFLLFLLFFTVICKNWKWYQNNLYWILYLKKKSVYCCSCVIIINVFTLFIWSLYNCIVFCITFLFYSRCCFVSFVFISVIK